MKGVSITFIIIFAIVVIVFWKTGSFGKAAKAGIGGWWKGLITGLVFGILGCLFGGKNGAAIGAIIGTFLGLLISLRKANKLPNTNPDTKDIQMPQQPQTPPPHDLTHLNLK